jgi:hypothetical protein
MVVLAATQMVVLAGAAVGLALGDATRLGRADVAVLGWFPPEGATAVPYIWQKYGYGLAAE